MGKLDPSEEDSTGVLGGSSSRHKMQGLRNSS